VRLPRPLPAALIAVMLLPPAAARPEWVLEAFTGTAHSFTSPLTVRQPGFRDFGMDARYETRPFSGSPYDSARVGWWKGTAGWELQLVHHKLYLANPTPQVSRLELSHGYNLLTANRATELRGWALRVGAGAVVTFPETTVRGRSRPAMGYDLSGFTAAVGVGRRWPRASRLALSGELKLTLSWARIPVFDGEADVPNRALHVLLGIGYRF
jgi:hypothetical protein